MTNFARHTDRQLQTWLHQANRKPLIIQGARQVGKTHAVRYFAEQAKLELIELNFDFTPKLKVMFEEDLDPSRIIREIELFTNQRIDSTKTLLFFDEVQESPRALMSLRYFYEKAPAYKLIAAGSLLDFALEKISFPVGRVNYLTMGPFSFKEFLNASGRALLCAEIPSLNLSSLMPKKLSKMACDKLYAALQDYFFVGGLPEAVAEFHISNSFSAVTKVHLNLLNSYRNDMLKYSARDLQLENTHTVFQKIFGFVGKQVKYSEVGEQDNTRRTKKTLQLLERARIIKKVPTTNPNGLPLGAEVKDKIFKTIFLDVGLGQAMSGMDFDSYKKASDLLGVFSGRLAEQFVGQELLHTHQETFDDLYCWIRAERSSQAEVDYVISRGGKIIGVEVKNTSEGRARSLHMMMKKYDTFGVILKQTSEITVTGNLITMPLFSEL